MTQDIKLTQDSNGNWDLNILNGDFELSNSLDTALYLSVFSNKRASESEVSDSLQREGHLTNEFYTDTNFELGSKLWLYTRQKKNIENNLPLIETSIIESLKWMIEDGIISDVSVSASKSGEQISIEVELINRLSKTSKYYNLFYNL